MINIGFIITALRTTGPTNILYGIVKNLDRQKFKPYIITLKEEPYDSRIEDFKKLDVDIILVKYSRIATILGQTKRLEKIIEKYKIDILHTHCVMSSILISKLHKEKLKVKTINTIHCDFRTYLMENFGFFWGYIYYLLYKSSLKKNNVNFSCGKSVAQLNYIHSGLKTGYIMNGIEVDLFNYVLKNSSKQIRIKLGLKENAIYYIATSLNKGKNTEFLIENLKNKKEYLILLGDGEIRSEILKNNYSNLICPGKVSINKVAEYLRASDYFLSASKSEGMPNAVLEALYLELPVLLSDIGPHKEILELVEENVGYLFINDNSDSFINKKNLLENTIYTKKNFKAIKERITAKVMSSRYQKEYEKLYRGEI